VCGRMREYELFLRLLAEKVYTARLSNGSSLQDLTDFHIWLVECAEKAARTKSLEDFFKRLD
jgi:hypothetical protein